MDVVHHGGLDTTFATILYTNAAQTNGVVRIFVKRSTISGGNDFTYTIDPAERRTMSCRINPHLGLSNGFLYLTTNNIPRGKTWIGSQIRRFNASQMANCQTASTTTHTYVGTDGQRILTAVENASTTQYFGVNRTANLFRVIRLSQRHYDLLRLRPDAFRTERSLSIRTAAAALATSILSRDRRPFTLAAPT